MIIGQKVARLVEYVTAEVLGALRFRMKELLDVERRSIEGQLHDKHVPRDSMLEARLRGELTMIEVVEKRLETMTSTSIFADVLLRLDAAVRAGMEKKGANGNGDI